MFGSNVFYSKSRGIEEAVMGLPTSCLLIITALVAACEGGRNSQLIQTSPTTPAPAAAPLPTLPATRALLTDMPTPPPAACPDAVSTTNPIGRLKTAMRSISYTQMNAVFDAFIVFYTDEHLSEEPSAEERRLEYISGWDGIGIGVVVADGGAALWVPGGDVGRAKAAVGCAWLVLDVDDPGQPTIAEWIAERLGRQGRVGADARFTSIAEWQTLNAALQLENLQLFHVTTVLDQIWIEEQDPQRRRPEFSRIVANLHNMQYTGLSWREKVSAVRNELSAVGADAMVVTTLDEVAWLLNVRGRDLPNAPLLKAFVIISQRDVRVYAPPGKLSMPVREALAVYNCYSNNNNCTRVNDYVNIYADLRRATESKILIPISGTFQRGASAAIAQSIPQSKRFFQLSPIIYLKAQKNEAEAKGIRRAHLRDAVAMCTLLSYLEGIVNRMKFTELSVGEKVDVTRATQAGYVGVSMRTRVAFGPSGSEPEYRPTNSSKRTIFKNSTLIIQSGGQYDEGTTVVTRTMHYGSASAGEKRAYTLTLRALAALAALQSPAVLPAAHVDPVARAPLWAARQDYPHPTGYGLGAALNRKEDPVVIDYRQDTNLHTFREGYFITNEPAWYEPGKYGIRLGNVLEVKAKDSGYLTFLEATLVPYEPKLIDKNMLTEYETNWLNSYNERIRKIVGPELKDQGLMNVYYWMMNKTIHIEPPSKLKRTMSNSAENQKIASLFVGVIIANVFSVIA